MISPSDKPVLLLVDDSPSIHRLLTFKLKNDGLEFLAAYSGYEGVELAEAQQPSLILLDLSMPGMDGFDAIRHLKDNPATMGIPIIIISGTQESADKVLAFELGAMDFVTKPFDVHELRARIQSAIKLDRLMKMLEQQAQIDGLTGLWNRAHLDERIKSEIESVRRKNAVLSLVICDLDHFKRLNDTFGHPAGDAVLETFAAVLRREVRAYDVPCRYGGEEFAIILPDTSIDEAKIVCERIRVAIEKERWPIFPDMRATASFGCTSQGVDGVVGCEEWIKAADQALYDAKRNGRNRVVLYGQDAQAAKPETDGDGNDLRLAS